MIDGKRLLINKIAYYGGLALSPQRRRALDKLSDLSKITETWGSMLERAAARWPDNAAIKCEEANLTYAQYNAMVNRYAHFFISQGIGRGSVVAVFLATRPEMLAIYSALGKLGAVNAMINTNLRQDSLSHVLTLNRADAFIVGQEVLEAFGEVAPQLNLEPDQRLYYVPDEGGLETPAGFTDLTQATASMSQENPAQTSQVEPFDALAYVFTSGTTGGLPKAAVLTHIRVITSVYLNGFGILNMKGHDTMYVPLPFFHTNALSLSWPTVLGRGAALAVRRKFSASQFLDDVRKYNVTAFCYVGELCRYLMNQPARPDDHVNPLVKIIGNGLRDDIWVAFKKRFGIKKVFEIYGAAESNLYFVNLFNMDATIGVGLIPYAIVRYDIDNDEVVRDAEGKMIRVKPGEAGLILGEISPRAPLPGYTNKQTTEAKVFRDVFKPGDAWFNSGDLVRDIGHGHARFVDRLGDTFRWKGENVSTTEVEAVANTHPLVELSTVYGVLMPSGDGRAGMAALRLTRDASDEELAGLARHFRQGLPEYAVPKFIRLIGEFESTATHKIKKVDLKKQGFDPALITDPLYVLLPGAETFTRLTPMIHEEIMAQRHRF